MVKAAQDGLLPDGREGALVIFNTRNPHEVASGTANTAGSRVSIGSFAGRKPNGSLVLWA